MALVDLPRTTDSKGGDQSVKRVNVGGEARPSLLTLCELCDGKGRIPSEKRPGNTVRCKRQSCTDGTIEKTFRRVTTFIDVLQDKKTLSDWAARQTLLGAAINSDLLEGILDLDADSKEGKARLNALAEAAQRAAGSHLAAQRGDEVHKLTEDSDLGLGLPEDATFEDVMAVAEYHRISAMLEPTIVEKLMVLDDLGVAGTPDRVERILVDMVAPDGSVLEAGDLLITDLKTGSLFDGLKMAMQLAIYSRSSLYDPEASGYRSVVPVDQDWGLIKHVPTKGGVPRLYWVDLQMGWEAVLVAERVHAQRRLKDKALHVVTM